MPNVLDGTGLTTATQSELYTNMVTGFQTAYGADTNFGSSTPDGQAINIVIQSILDVLDLVTQVYNSFDPDLAIGAVLDQRCAINGVIRQGGTFTVTPVTIVTTQSLNLYGLDQTAQPVYTVADNAGNQWQLQTTQLALASGTHEFNFQAAVPGAQLTVPNTITQQVTVVLGVQSVNNPTTYTTLGLNEESDANLKLRRSRSVSIASQGWLPGLISALQNTSGVSYANVYENDTSTTNSDGIPGHSIWVVVAGSATASAIANAIYQKRNGGCGMFGSQTFSITQVNGIPIIISWDDVIPQNLFISFTASSIDGVTPPDIGLIRTSLVTSFVPNVDQEVNINALATAAQVADSNALVTAAGLSLGTSQIATLSGVAASGSFKISYAGNASAAILWNDSIGTIQTKVQAVSGLSTATVTGSIASQTLTFNLSSLTAGVQGLLTVVNNSLQTSVPAAITFAWNENYSNTLSPTSKKNQFAVSAANIIILPMQLSPSTVTVIHGLTQTFLGLGGYGAYVYSFQTNNSSGTINSSSGLYTAGGTFPVTDTILVTDTFGNTATASVSVI